ncbi:MAG: GAF domain-containing protein [Anaerolineae bacterium]|nr:GAF domain-containing protein [Anaerolineae bacterium]
MTQVEQAKQPNTILRKYVRILARYERLMELSRALISTLDISVLLEQIVVAAAELTDTEASSILLLDKATGTLRFEAAFDPMGVSLASIDVPLENSIAGWVVSHGEPLVITDARSEPMFFSKVDEESDFQTRSLLAVPMRAHNKVIGCLEALNKKDDHPFTDEDISTLTTLAAQAALTIENARLFQQNDFISEMVHELRTPLAAINATTHILKRADLVPEQHMQMVNTIAQETKRLTRMTTDFLDLARLESGRSRLARNPIDLGEILQSAVETVSPQADEHHISLKLEISPAPLPSLTGDGEKLKQVVLNLLTNAIKYNREKGSVSVTAAHYEPHIVVTVRDTGLGIAPENLPHMFEKFYRVADTEGYTTGTGLGLAITRRIVEGHGGSITVESDLGVGTTFTIMLPLHFDPGVTRH